MKVLLVKSHHLVAYWTVLSWVSLECCCCFLTFVHPSIRLFYSVRILSKFNQRKPCHRKNFNRESSQMIPLKWNHSSFFGCLTYQQLHSRQLSSQVSHCLVLVCRNLICFDIILFKRCTKPQRSTQYSARSWYSKWKSPLWWLGTAGKNCWFTDNYRVAQNSR